MLILRWKHNTDKIIKILKVVRKVASETNIIITSHVVDELIQRLSQAPILQDKDISSRDATALFPIENIRGYSIYYKNIDRDMALNELSRYRYAIASIDSSYHSPGGHGYIPFLIHNIGVWYVDYKNGFGGEDNRVFTTIKFEYSDINERTWMKENEFSVIKDIIKVIKGDVNFIMLDESLSLGYTSSWSFEDRKKYASIIAKYISYIINNNVIPLGIYYTRSIDIVRGMRDLKILSDDEYRKFTIPDKVLMNKILRSGERSPIFKVYSLAHTNTDLNLHAIYVKISNFNILRVEYPAIFDDKIDDIHRVVLLESIIGDGYPYPLQASHENAVLTTDIRDAIIEVFCEELGMPNEIYLSSKEVSKRWPLA